VINHTLWKEKRGGRFFPHITVARVKGKSGERQIEREMLCKLGASIQGGSVVDRIILYRSQLRQNGACYSNFGSLSLGRQDDLEEK
jgi:2'-5' RNA ligase